MIITKTPFRISFFGGGSDLASYYRKYGGCVLSTSINKYIYLSIHPYFDSSKIVLKYSKTEIVDNVKQIQHPIFKCALTEYNINGVEITSTADIPSGTGLGSSSSFTVGLLHTLNCYKGKYVSKGFLASDASRIEIEELLSPIGKQDQYAAAFGGLNLIRFYTDDSVTVEPIMIEHNAYRKLQENLIMFYTGDVRTANSILTEQNRNMNETDKIECLKKMCKIAEDMKYQLNNGCIDSFGEKLHENWLLKKQLANGISNEQIDKYYYIAINNGAEGGKLLGAGGGGFLLFYCQKEKQQKLREVIGLNELKFSFEKDGSSIVFIGDKYWD